MKEMIQKEENWYQKCLLILEYHEGETKKRSERRNFKWRVSDTARELELSIGYISESLKLAKYPLAIIATFSREEALKIIRGKI